MSETEKQDLGELRFLFESIVKTINLPDFIEEETGEKIQWSIKDHSAKCCCPLHQEKEPSFHINFLDGVWIFHCFGCGAKGTVIHFCKEYHDLRNKLEAVYYLCKKYKIENTSDLILEGIKQVSVKVDEQRVLENYNILLSNQCRILLRKNFELHKKWVARAYKKINSALDQQDKVELDKISQEASKRISLKGEE
jgi:hypothetical protein